MLTIYIRRYSVMCIIGNLAISTLLMEEIVESIKGKSHIKKINIKTETTQEHIQAKHAWWT